MTFPDTDLDVTVRMAFGADLTADPGDWDFTDMSTRLVDTAITISRGAAVNGQPTAGSCDLDLRNDDGELSPDNAESTLWPYVEQDVPIEILAGPGDDERFTGFVASYKPSFIPTTDNEPLSVMHLQAAGIMRRLTQAAQNKPLGSPLRRSMSGVAPGDYVPHAYWPLEDGSGATQFASGLPNGTAATTSGTFSAASASTPAGSAPLPEFDLNARVILPIPAYTNSGQWVMQWVVNIPASPAADPQLLAEFRTPGGTVTRWTVTLEDENPSPDAIYVRGYNAAGTELVSAGTAIEHGDLGDSTDFYGHTFMFTVATFQLSTNINVWFEGIREDGLNMEAALGVVAGTHGGLAGNVTLTSPIDGTVLGHPGVFVDPNFNATYGASDADVNAAALDGFAGETTLDRWDRILTEARVRHSSAGTSTTTMGAQSVDATLLDLIAEINDAEQGAVTEKDFGLHLICRTARYNLPVGLTVDLSTYRTAAGTAPAVLAPTYSDQGYRNEWTVEQTSGSSAVVQAGADEIARRGLYDEAVTVNLGDAADLVQHASWRLERDLLNRVRHPGTPLDVGENSVVDVDFMADWFALELGAARIQRTNVPGLHGVGTIDELLEGYSERLERRRLTVTYDGPPYAPYIVAELDDDDLGKLDTAGCVMQAAATSGATSFTVATTVLPKWTTDAGEMPIPILVSGQVNSVTAVANVSPAFVAAGTVAHASNASVTPTMPAGVQAGDLLLVLAAIRNSGTGTVNTPSGYTVLLTSGNMTLLGKVHTGTESAPTITFTGGAANADTSAQMAAFRGTGITVHASTAQLNASAQNIAYPAMDVSRANCVVVYAGWKADDWTSVTGPGTEIGEPDTTTGDDQGIVWAYTIQTTATAVAAGSFTVTGGAGAISRGAVIALATDVQTMTVTRGTNGVSKAIPIGSRVNVYRPARLAL